ncbi:uncharacterized protein LOC111284300 [Durio zibethinus]|uniref:Uncharacterized protein LOC111284300 n=1 Tax=Durio zibethinus TaxID=66656 RepID=A0A6P5XLF5_DURZI|nr:uncharacterized protein LOC111284300 [Durio zibethinus]
MVKDFGEEHIRLTNKPLNKKITFSYSDDEDDDDEMVDDEGEGEGQGEGEVIKSDTSKENEASQESLTNKDLDHHNSDDVCHGKVTEETRNSKKAGANIENQADNLEEPPAKKRCLETDSSKSATYEKENIEAELKGLGDKSEFLNLDPGCNGVIFVQMRKRDGDPGPKDIVQHMMTSAASTRKHMSRFILRVLLVEVACYASEEEITRAMTPLIVQYFPVETQNPRKEIKIFLEILRLTTIALSAPEFALPYETHANSVIDRMKIINSISKSLPAPQKVDLSKS